MIENLISSKTRVDVLKLFLFNPENNFYQRQISLLTHQSIREIEKLQKIGLIEKSVQGNRIYYKINKESPIFEELKSIFFKTTGISEVLKKKLKKKSNIRIAFIYGSYAKGEENLLSDIDLFVVGDITLKELSAVLSKPKRELGRTINYALSTAEEFRKKIIRNDHFLTTLLREKKIFIIGDENELETIIKPGQIKIA
jgi:predicted nucleotidyltransferase